MRVYTEEEAINLMNEYVNHVVCASKDEMMTAEEFIDVETQRMRGK